MTNRGSNTLIINDDAAENAAEGRDVYSRDARERDSETSEQTFRPREAQQPANVRQVMTIPAVPRDALVKTPSAETGIISAVKFSGESDEGDEAQDASRTDAERGLEFSSMPAPQIDQAANGETNTERASVLIIEDTPELVEILGVILGRMGLTISAEPNGGRAYSRFVEMNPDVVLLDLALPDVTGWKVLEAIKERQRITEGKMPVIIVMTAYGDAANRVVGKLHDVHSYLIKPFTADEVERVIWDALGRTTAG
jgi:CheY-like chemotaxis protein